MFSSVCLSVLLYYQGVFSVWSCCILWFLSCDCPFRFEFDSLSVHAVGWWLLSAVVGCLARAAWVGWAGLAGWLVGWLVGRLVGWLVLVGSGWLVG